jgi:uncharacterized membrane protein
MMATHPSGIPQPSSALDASEGDLMNRNIAATSGVFVICMLAVATWTTLRLPAGTQVPIHFNLTGVPDHWTTAWPGLFILPFVTVVIAILFSILPASRAWGQALQKSNAYEIMAVVIIVMMALSEFLLIAVALGLTANAVRFSRR